MSAARRSGRHRGFTMVELLVAITVSSVVLMAAYVLLRNNQRFYRSQSQIVDVQQNLRAATEILAAELRELSADGGDILNMSSPTSLTIRAMRGLGIVCEVKDAASGRLVLDSASWSYYRLPDQNRDGLVIFADGDVDVTIDDQWLVAGIAGVGIENCANGSRGIRIDVSGVPGGNAALAGVTIGAPVRSFETVRYELFDDGAGRWWLAASTLASGAWTANSPVAGPLRPRDGLSFTYLNAAEAQTTNPLLVTSILVTARGRSSQPVSMQGRPVGNYEDSLSVRAMLRGN